MKINLLFILLFLPATLIAQNTYYVATDGSDANPGTFSQPWATWQYAIDHMANGGDTIYVRGGTYYLSGLDPWVVINPLNNHGENGGGVGSRSFFGTYPPDYEAGNPAILDCNNARTQYATNYSAFGLENAQYWHIYGLVVRNAWQRDVGAVRAQGIGGTTSASIIFENCTTHDITGRGFYFESGAWNEWDGEGALWENDSTYWINCDTYNICDSLTNTSGDGWKTGNYIGGYFKFMGCRAWNYADDAFDPGGAGLRIIENCIAMSTTKYSGLGSIEGNGFKVGGIGEDQGGHYTPGFVFTYFINNIAADCIGIGFYVNMETYEYNDAQANPVFYNNVSYHNYSGYFDVFQPSIHGNIARTTLMRNNLAFNNTNANYEQCAIYRPSIYTESNNTWVATQLTGDASWPGWEYNPAVTVTNGDFQSLDLSQLIAPRKSDGSLPDMTVFRLATGSDLIGAGTYVGMSQDPDIGIDWAYIDENDSDIETATVLTLAITDYNAVQAVVGANVISDGGGTLTAKGVCYSTNENPTIADSKVSFPAGTGSSSIRLTTLKPGTTYHFRAYATNETGTSYGSDVSITTPVHSTGTFSGKIGKVNGKWGIVR